MRKNKNLNKFRQWIQENFFTLIIFLVLLFLIILTVGLFVPINVSDFPTESIELERYNAGVERRTILIRSISSLISGVSVIIAFVSLIQSRNSEEKRERMQVMPFPAYGLPLEDLQDASASSTVVNIKEENSKADHVLQAQFDVRIKNIGLGSLVDYEIKKACYLDKKGQRKNLDSFFTGNFILGKEETNRMVVNLRFDLESKGSIEIKNLEQIKVLANFKDLLGHSYEQEFTVQSKTYSLGRGEIKKADGDYEKGNIYSLEPEKITHSHPNEKINEGDAKL